MTIDKTFKSIEIYTELISTYGKRFNPEIKGFFQEVEYEMVKQDKRECNVYHLKPSNYDVEIDKIFDDGLVFKSILRSKKYSGFSHSHFEVEELNDNSMVFGVVAKDLKTANKFKDYNLEQPINHIEIGKMLGYPECCCKAFENNFKISYDPIYETALNTKDTEKDDKGIIVKTYYPELRNDLRYAGVRIIPWFPCSFDCEESKKKSKVWLDMMYSLNEKLTEEILDLLSKPSTWSLLNSQIRVIHPDFQIQTSGYFDDEYKEVRFL